VYAAEYNNYCLLYLYGRAYYVDPVNHNPSSTGGYGLGVSTIN